MKIVYGLALTACFALVFSTARAGESRQVTGGDVIYSAQASAVSERDALFQAEGQAVRMLSIECSVPPRTTKVFQQLVTLENGRFIARVQIGAPLADCETANRASIADKAQLANRELFTLQTAYAHYLLDHNPPAAPAPARMVVVRPDPGPYRFSRDELASADRTIETRLKNRESERQLGM